MASATAQPKGRESFVRQPLIRTFGLLTAVVIAVLTTATASSAAAAAPAKQQDAVNIVGILLDNRTTPKTPVAGVKITVLDDEGNVVGEDLSGKDGRFKIPIGDAIKVLGNTYTVRLDDSTLPEDSYLTDPDAIERSFQIKTDQDYAVNFDIGPDIFAEDPWYEQALDLAVSGILLGLLLALASLGLSMVFGTTGLTNFAHGELVTFGAVVAYFFDSDLGVPVILAGIIAVILSGAFGWAQDAGLWRPLRRRGTGLIAMMIVSIGLGLFLRNVYQYLFGADSHNYTQYATVAPWTIGPIDLTPKDFIAGVLCIVILVAVSLVVTKTRLGKATRAVSDSPSLAASSGINVNQVITIVWVVGAALAGAGGFLFGLTQSFDYQVGFKILLLIFAAVILGGLGTIWGVMVGSLIVGLAVEESTLIIPAELKYTGALVLLILVLLVRPQGILGRRERIG
ncbi:MAG TPA: branched-chain amino acid ABC transporter permease [Nocardioidaceae bacterium]|nr:branched-chain amino acid ABC transporter permease [Nocardioidaceae bacterium]